LIQSMNDTRTNRPSRTGDKNGSSHLIAPSTDEFRTLYFLDVNNR
jgi:hypothetical protein